MAAYRGYRRANGLEDKPASPTEAEFDEAVRRSFDDNRD
jgi:hypothetical protein